MKIFKFGGASVKDADGVRNILSVLKHTGFKDTFIVVSAMGKTTNELEKVVQSYFENKEQFPKKFEAVRSNHHKIIEGLFPVQICISVVGIGFDAFSCIQPCIFYIMMSHIITNYSGGSQLSDTDYLIINQTVIRDCVIR